MDPRISTGNQIYSQCASPPESETPKLFLEKYLFGSDAGYRLANKLIVPSYLVPRRSSWDNRRVLDYSNCTGDSIEEVKRCIGSMCLGIIGSKQLGQILLVDKAFPHSKIDLMLLIGSTKPPYMLAQLSESTKCNLEYIFTHFKIFTEKKGLLPVVAFSIDPATMDRTSPQGLKRLHFHLIAHDEDSLTNAASRAEPFADLGLICRRNIVDESTILGGSLLSEVLLNNGALANSYVIPPLSMGKTFLTLGTDDLSVSLLTILQKVEDLVFNLHEVLVKSLCEQGRPLRKWDRPRFLSRSAATIKMSLKSSLIPFGISLASIESCGRYCEMFPSLSLPTLFKHCSGDDKKVLIDYAYPAAGPAYTCAIMFRGQRATIDIRTPLFSSIGGAGIIDFDGAIYRIDRQNGPEFSIRQLKERHEFLSDFSKEITKNS